MIDAVPSLRAAEGLSGSAVAAYLRSAGWTAKASPIPGVTVFSLVLPEADEPIHIVLPEAPGFGDEQRRVADALRTIEAVQERPIADIVDDIRYAELPHEWSASLIASAADASKRLTVGGTGDAIRALQIKLRVLGYYKSGIDGDFGVETEEAVLAFQRALGLSPTGIVDQTTATRLLASKVAVQKA